MAPSSDDDDDKKEERKRAAAFLEFINLIMVKTSLPPKNSIFFFKFWVFKCFIDRSTVYILLVL